MTQNLSRSMNESLFEGATDSRYRKVRPNTTEAPGMGDEIVAKSRGALLPGDGYGYITAQLPPSERVNPGNR